MTKHMSDRVLEATVIQLVEAEQGRVTAQAELDSFKADHPRPEPPGAFPTLRVFIEYYRRVRSYEVEVAKRERKLATAEKLYAQAAEQLQDVLPENVPLNYDYRGSLRDVIVKRQGEVSIEEPAPSAGP